MNFSQYHYYLFNMLTFDRDQSAEMEPPFHDRGKTLNPDFTTDSRQLPALPCVFHRLLAVSSSEEKRKTEEEEEEEEEEEDEEKEEETQKHEYQTKRGSVMQHSLMHLEMALRSRFFRARLPGSCAPSCSFARSPCYPQSIITATTIDRPLRVAYPPRTLPPPRR